MMCIYTCVSVLACFFFLFKQKTAYEMRISDWSSDVCSSDLQIGKKVTAYSLLNAETLPPDLATAGISDAGDLTYQYTPNTTVTPNTFCLTATSGGTKIGRASCRDRG